MAARWLTRSKKFNCVLAEERENAMVPAVMVLLMRSVAYRFSPSFRLSHCFRFLAINNLEASESENESGVFFTPVSFVSES